MPKSLRIIAPAAFIAAIVVALGVGLSLGGAADPRPFADPGEVVRYGMPVARTLVNISMAGLIGSLVMVIWALSLKRDEGRFVMDLAAGSAALLTAASVATLLLTYVDITGQELSGGEAFGAGLAQFVTEIPIGQLWLLLALLSAVTTVLCFAIRDPRWVLLPAVAALATTIPLAQQGHAAGAANHGLAVNSLLIHLVGASVWIGGLFVVLTLSRRIDRARLRTVLARYSTLALVAFIGVAVSGIASALLRVGSLDALFGMGYGKILVLKAACIVVLGMIGAIWRRVAIPRIEDGAKGSRFFASLVAVELAVMGAVSGLSGALGRTAPPVPQVPPSESGSLAVAPAEWLTGDPLPPELTPMSYFTEWKFDTMWGLVAVFGIAIYLVGVSKLRKRGDSWPILRTLALIAGMLLLFYTTNGAFNAYERYLFSQHMLGHMLLMMLIPLLLVLSAPVTLALRAFEKRRDGTWGGREWIMWAVQSPYSKFITHPAVTAVVFVGSLWVFYFTPLFRWAMVSHFGHTWMIVHFLISGYLFALSMIGIDPVPYRFPHALRIVTLFATMASHAFFGVTIMTGDGLLLSDWFGAMGREWGDDPLTDQKLGGGIAWGIGELPTLLLALTVAIQWSRDDDRVQKRRDRYAERSDEAELRAYNAELAARAVQDEKSATRRP